MSLVPSTAPSRDRRLQGHRGVNTKIGRFAFVFATALVYLYSTNAHAENTAERLVALVGTGNVAALESYLATPGVTVNDRPDVDKSLLDYAAEQNQSSIAAYLLDHGATVDAVGTRFNTGLTALHRAAYFNAVDVAELLLAHGADVNANFGRGTPLIYAASNGSLSVAQLLLKHGADPAATNRDQRTALSEAAAHGHSDIVNLLSASPATPPPPPPRSLIDAAVQGNLAGVRLLLRYGYDQDTRDSALRAALISGFAKEDVRKQIIDELLRHGANINNLDSEAKNTPIMLAQTPEILEFLIGKGADVLVDAPGGTVLQAVSCNASDPVSMYRVLIAHGVNFATAPKAGPDSLWCAIHAGRQDAVRFLLEHGASPNRPMAQFRTALFAVTDPAMAEILVKHGAHIDTLDTAGHSALRNAIGSRRSALAVQLLQLDADMRAASPSDAPLLHLAIESAQADVVAALLDKGAVLNALDSHGHTPLQVAVLNGQLAIVSTLLDHGVNIGAQDPEGDTALHLAARSDNSPIVAELLRHRANPAALNKAGQLPAQLAHTNEVRALFGFRSDSDILSPGIIADCAQVAKRASLGTLDQLVTTDVVAEGIPDPGEDWDYLNQDTTRRPIALNGRRYFLASAAGPAYLSRVGGDGIEQVLCEFAQAPAGKPPSYRALSEYERLEARAERDAVSVSAESLKRIGAVGAEALLGAVRRKESWSSLSIALDDAIRAHRDDVLAFYLDHGVDPSPNWADPSGVTGERRVSQDESVIYTATRYGSDASVQLLLAHGANPDGVGDFDHSPVLRWAVRHGQLATVRTLLAYGADPNMPASRFGVMQTVDEIFHDEPTADHEAAGVRLLLLHGANPDVWLYAAFQSVARRKNRNDLLGQLYRTPGTRVQTAWVASALASPGALDPRIVDLLNLALQLRDAADCPPGASDQELRICLPKMLTTADRELNVRYTTLTLPGNDSAKSIQQRQRAWIRQRDRQCGLGKLPSATSAGWIASVLSEPSRARCVLEQTRQRLTELPRSSP